MIDYSRMAGVIFKKRRMQAGLSLRMVHTLAGVSASQIHNIESGKNGMTLDVFIKLCRVLCLNPSSVLGQITHTE